MLMNHGSKLVNLLLKAAVVLYAVPPGMVSAAEDEADGRLRLFAEPGLLSERSGSAKLRLHRPVMQEVVLVHDKPWEGNTSGYHTVFRDGDTYRMYYRGWHYDKEEAHPPLVCMAESPDGIHWTRPSLGLIEFEGSTDNNIVWRGAGSHNFTPFKDPNPDCPPEALYKAVGGEGKPGLFAFQSSDGVHWEQVGDAPMVTDGAFDSQNLAFWDETRSEYRLYYRDFRDGVRDIKTATSADFRNWTPGRWLAYPDAPVEHLYTSQIQPYERAPHLFVGFPSRYLQHRGSLVEGLFMASIDGLTFHRRQEAIIRPGRNPDRWYNRSNYIWLGLLETESAIPGAGPELSLYTNERYYRGSGVKTRRYTYRLDGFISLHADYAGGQGVTRPVLCEGGQLLLNVATAAAGSVRVELQDEEGRVMPGYSLDDCDPIFGDDPERRVSWKGKGSLNAFKGREVRLRFELRDADVYAFRFSR